MGWDSRAARREMRRAARSYQFRPEAGNRKRLRAATTAHGEDAEEAGSHQQVGRRLRDGRAPDAGESEGEGVRAASGRRRGSRVAAAVSTTTPRGRPDLRADGGQIGLGQGASIIRAVEDLERVGPAGGNRAKVEVERRTVVLGTADAVGVRGHAEREAAQGKRVAGHETIVGHVDEA